MMTIPKKYEQIDEWKTVMFMFNSALKEIGTKIEILNNEFQHVHNYNPIEHVKSRIKSPESIVTVSYTHLDVYKRQVTRISIVFNFTFKVDSGMIAGRAYFRCFGPFMYIAAVTAFPAQGSIAFESSVIAQAFQKLQIAFFVGCFHFSHIFEFNSQRFKTFFSGFTGQDRKSDV